MAKATVVIRRSVNYGGDRKASSYLIEGANGYRFSKCSIFEAEEFTPEMAKTVLSKARRNDPHKKDATYDIVLA